jgi:CheY-specific phosphatase CheX
MKTKLFLLFSVLIWWLFFALSSVWAVNPTVTNVSATPTTWYYKSWGTVDITVTFSEAVFVTGTPTITLNTTPTRTWNYLSWDGTTILTFRYTIESWDTSTGLDYASTTALALNGWTIKDAATNDATLALANPWDEHSLWYNTDIVIDTTKPTCTFDYDPDSWPVNTDVIATCTPSEPVTYQQPSWTNAYTFTTNGSYEFQFTDNAWNTWSSTATVNWIDKTAPVLTQVTAVPTPTNNTTPSYTFSSTETGTITYSWSCSSTTTGAISWENTITFNTLAEWTYSNCTIVVKDVAGNASNTLNVNTFMIDTTKPTCSTFTYNPTSWTVVNTDVVATCTPSEPVTYQQPLWTGVYTFTENGSYEFQFTDNAWNTWSGTATVDWIDKTAPVLTQVTAVPTPTNNTTPSYTFSSTETGTITYSWSCSSTTTGAISWENTITFNTLAEWTYSNCTIVVKDVAGNASNTLNVNTFMIDTTKPTCSTFTYNPTSWTVVNTDVVATCTPSEPVTYQQPLWTGVYTFTENGSYEFQFTDNAWNTWSSTATVDWIDKTAPVVTLNGSTTMTVTRWWTFTDPWASWEDNVDGTGTITTANSGTVDAGTVWTYILEYRHTDTAWNKSDTVTRTVTVRVKKVTSSKEEQLSTGQTEPEVLDDETSEKTLDELVGDYMEKYKDNPEKLKQLETAMKSAKDSDVDQELKDAYVYAFLNGITTQATIEKAELDRGITRAEMAKMMAVFATKISDKERVKTGIVKYADVDSSLGDLADYILLAYQLQIMGIDANGNPIENFNPHAEVTRAEFATVLSRILYGNKYNQQGSDFYSKHLQALKNASILKNTTPTMKELRGWVMLMLYRS